MLGTEDRYEDAQAQDDFMARIVEKVCLMINANFKEMLPSLARQIGQVEPMLDKIKLLQSKVDQLAIERSASKTQGAGSDFDLHNMKFTLNSVKADVDLMKAVVTGSRVDKIEEEVKKIKNIDFDLETLKYQMQYTANKE